MANFLFFNIKILFLFQIIYIGLLYILYSYFHSERQLKHELSLWSDNLDEIKRQFVINNNVARGKTFALIFATYGIENATEYRKFRYETLTFMPEVAIDFKISTKDYYYDLNSEIFRRIFDVPYPEIKITANCIKYNSYEYNILSKEKVFLKNNSLFYSSNNKCNESEVGNEYPITFGEYLNFSGNRKFISYTKNEHIILKSHKWVCEKNNITEEYSKNIKYIQKDI